MLEALRSEQESQNSRWHCPWGGNWAEGEYIGYAQEFFVAKFDLDGGDMKVDTTNIRSVKLNTPEPPRPSTGDDGG